MVAVLGPVLTEVTEVHRIRAASETSARVLAAVDERITPPEDLADQPLVESSTVAVTPARLRLLW